MTRILVWLWIFTLSLATVGISVHRVYCYCIGHADISLFVAAQDECKSATSTSSKEFGCCAPKLALKKACCEQSDDSKDCTEKSVKVFQLKPDFLVVKADLASFDFDFVPTYSHFEIDSIFPNFLPYPAPAFPRPPPRSGRLICITHGVFLC